MAPTMKLPVVLYHYDGSPFATKVKNLLALKKIPHTRVAVSTTLPRPDLADRLGVTYRRIPVLAIGKDVYCDTSLIAAVLERRFPPSEGYATFFPARKGGGKADTGMIKALSFSYGDRTVFPLAAENLPYKKFPPEFLKDRSAWLGRKIDADAMEANQPVVKSWLISHLTLLEEQLADGREWLMDTETPSLADITVHFPWVWMQQFRALRDLFDRARFPATIAWITRTTDYIAKVGSQQQIVLDNIAGARAAEIIASSPAPEDPKIVGFDAGEAARLGIERGQVVSVTPSDNGKVPTVGRLVSLNHEEVAIETKGSSGTSVHCHFPRLNFVIKPAAHGAGAKL
ncbi:uncharacterized protein TRAVEDRAFT_162670 [Trametes versicolor FP-101664 SS1]|uniref:uncharacterized protein n=1 Tax=Trametes versicolor (strain FP-101664) TaxID=717944 RepID=UPI0004623CC5|nr:uncharacterized protein TRAVEDRAFT_162670 [Trametes versicolor FP-101664 SS1]EIW61458.1 hypothetical protein TRAVEDRAFT_162670 [Trametes versicolor FP-101664 SS1]